MAKNRSSSNAAKQLGSRGGKKGGPARAKALTSSQRSAIASKGGKAKAAANKGKKPFQKKKP
jgi:hypothetical protein